MKSTITALFITLFALSTVSYAQSAHSGSVQVALMDGSVRFVSSSIDQASGAGKVHFADLGGVNSLGVYDALATNTIQIESVFPATYLGGVRVSAADLPAASESQCLASTDFSAAVPMSPDGFAIVFDRPTSTIRFSFGVDRELGYGCKVVRLSGNFNGDGRVDAADYVVWRRAEAVPSGNTQYTTNIMEARRAGSRPTCYLRYTLKRVFVR